MLIEVKQLHAFLFESQLEGYANEQTATHIKENDHSTTIVHKKGLWRFHDNYFGGEPYGGRSVIFYKEKPLWMMVYYGSVTKNMDFNIVYKVLRGALMLTPHDAPFRGPKEYHVGNFTYSNKWEGSLVAFSGQEQITQNQSIIYTASYMGGMVDQQREF